MDTLPSVEIDRSLFVIPPYIQSALADPQFHVPEKIDVLLGSEIFNILGDKKWILSDIASLLNT